MYVYFADASEYHDAFQRSLGFDSCDALCSDLQASTSYTYKECHDYIQKQRQVCLYASNAQQERINTAFKVMGVRGTTVFGASGDGGSHWSFGAFSAQDPIGAALNTVGCQRMSPLFPANSPYIVAVGGLAWPAGDASNPVAWSCKEHTIASNFPFFPISKIIHTHTHTRTHMCIRMYGLSEVTDGWCGARPHHT